MARASAPSVSHHAGPGHAVPLDAAGYEPAAGRRLPRSAPDTGGGFFLFGIGTKQQHLGPGETRTCPRCHNTTQWTRMREFKQFTLFFVPVARWKRRQFEACGICGTAVEV